MTKFIIAYDDKDPKSGLGPYFEKCKNNLTAFLSEKGIRDIIEIPNRFCNQPYIEIKVKEVNSNSFCFVAFSHGNEKAVTCGNEEYVKTNENTHLFNNAVFYTNSCSSGKHLGKDLINKGCKAFMGYDNPINAFLWDENLSVKIDNYALFLFIEKDISLFHAYHSMLKYYDTEIEKLEELDGGIIDLGRASELIFARSSLVFYGDKELKMRDL